MKGMQVSLEPETEPHHMISLWREDCKPLPRTGNKSKVMLSVEKQHWGEHDQRQLRVKPSWLKASSIQKPQSALAGVAQWIECRPAKQRASRSIPSQSTCLGCSGTRGNHTLMFLSLLLPPLRLSKMNKINKKKKPQTLPKDITPRVALRGITLL